MLKPVSWLLDKTFFVPKYQRGYRWTKKQVTDLLDDIHEFSCKDRTKDEFYCLQPLVVKKSGEKWNLIDGQQRLTTIVLLVKYFNEKMPVEKQELPVLEYETGKRSKSYIENLEIQGSEAKSSESSKSYIDFYYMAEAYETINAWVESHNKSSDFGEKFQSVFFNNAKIIWYETDENEDEIEYFTRINRGKIPLTNAELIKALFLQKRNFTQESDMTIHRYEMAEDWDRIEHKLQDNSFWYFLTKDKPYAYSRIEIIFDLLYEKETGKKKSKDEPLTTYLFFAEKSRQSGWDVTTQWNQVKEVFDTLCEWYDDYERYHCVGYLIYAGKRIPNLYKLCQDKKKNEVLRELKKLMLKTIPGGVEEIKNIEYGQTSTEDLRRFYVLYNILYLLKIRGISRFPFDRLKTEKWDIEHIDSQTENPLEKLKDQIKWLEYTYSDLKSELEEFKDEIDFYKQRKKEDVSFSDLYNKIIEKISDNENQDKDSIGNLTLLDSGTNRAYGNALFPTKRKFIIKNDKEGRFIPPCTKNVFLKYYQENTAELRKWTAADVQEYEKHIENTFIEFFGGMEND